MKKILLFVFSVFSLISFAQWSNHSFVHGGLTRNYRIYVPAIYNPANSVPLIVALHGLGDNMTNFSGVGFDAVADTANFISVYPQAIADPNFGTAWNSGAGAFGFYPNVTVNDVDFIKSLIDTVSVHYNIHQSKIFSTGFSMGAFMTNRLACELSNKIASFASVSGTIGSGITCTPSRPISICHFHGTADATISYTANMYGMNAQPLVNFWVANNSCNTTPVHTNLPDAVPGDGYTIEHDVYSGGANGTVVEHFKVNNGPHTWLYIPANDIDYSTEIWKFFMDKMLPAPVGLTEYTRLNYVKVFPNPASGSFMILQTEENSIHTVELLDITGKIINRESFSGSTLSVDISKYATGIYYLKCFSKQGSLIGCQKISVQ
ncbi:MAG: T9SS type A sorting domain-containing protein [Bacteroidota bacterium]